MRSNAHQIDAMLECGEAIEREIAALAACRRTPAELDRLESLLAQMEKAGSSLGPHYAFHKALAEAGGNPYLEQAMAIVGNQMFLPSDRVMAGNMDLFHHTHVSIVDAIADSDPDRARQALTAHFRLSRHVMQLDQ